MCSWSLVSNTMTELFAAPFYALLLIIFYISKNNLGFLPFPEFLALLSLCSKMMNYVLLRDYNFLTSKIVNRKRIGSTRMGNL